LGYRIESGGAAFVYSVDHEPHAPGFGAGTTSAPPTAPVKCIHGEDQRHVDFLAGADLVVHDSQYTIEEYPQKEGWGHTPAEWAVDYAVAAGVKRLALTHHDPLRDDDAVDRVVEMCRQRARAVGSPLQMFAAAKKHEVRLTENGATAPGPKSPPERAMTKK